MMMGTSERMYGSVVRMHWPEPPFAADLASMRTDMLLLFRVLASSTDLHPGGRHTLSGAAPAAGYAASSAPHRASARSGERVT